MENFILFLFLLGTAVFVPCVLLQYECSWLENVHKILSQYKVEVDRITTEISGHMDNQKISYMREIRILKSDIEWMVPHKALLVHVTTQDLNSKLKNDSIARSNAIKEMTEKTKTMLKQKEEDNNKAIAKVKEEVAMQFKDKEAVYSTEIAELKAEIAILLEEKDNGIRSEIKKWRSKEHVAFSASIPAASNNLSDHQTVVYSKEITDTSSSYNPSDGMFTVPVSGVYVFTWSASCGDGRWQDTELVVDSSPYRSMSVDSNEKEYFGSAAQTVVLEIKKGQRVWVRIKGRYTRDLVGGNYNTFSGWILHTTV